jgi:hypothetical protein
MLKKWLTPSDCCPDMVPFVLSDGLVRLDTEEAFTEDIQIFEAWC